MWKHVGIALLALAAGIAIVWAGFEAEWVGSHLGPDAGQFVELSNRRLTAFVGGMFLLAAAQLSLLIWWVRSRSRTDFSGRYRIWRWAAPVAFIAAACVFIDLHQVWSRTLVWFLPVEFPYADELCWIAPLIGCGSVLLRDVMNDLRSCRTSTVLLWLAVLGWGISIGLLLDVTTFLMPSLRDAVIISAALAGHYFLFVSLLFHARHVIFVSAEPPELKPSLARRLLGRLAAVRAARRQRRSQHEPKTDAEESSKFVRKEKRITTAVSMDADSGTADSSGDDRKSHKSKKNSAGRTVRIDEPHSTQDLGDLSKKERRRLRKQQRAQQST